MQADAGAPLVAVNFRLREILDEAGISQSETSRKSGVSFATINRMCTNATRQVSLEVLDALCGALNLQPGDLFTLERGKRKGRK
jgi:putative transcriptional regulator